MAPTDPLALLEESASHHYQHGQTTRLELADDLRKMHDHRSTTQIAKWAKTNGLEGVSTQGRVVQLLRWSDVVHAATDQGVITAVITPSEWTLRPLFPNHAELDTQARIDLLAEAYKLAADEGTGLSSRHVKAAVEAAHPTPTKKKPKFEKTLEATLHKAPKKWVATRSYATWRAQTQAPMTPREAYDLCELLIGKYGSPESFLDAVREFQADQSGMPDIIE